jgi:hypothetical protein
LYIQYVGEIILNLRVAEIVQVWETGCGFSDVADNEQLRRIYLRSLYILLDGLTHIHI